MFSLSSWVLLGFDFLGFAVDTNLYVIEDLEDLDPKQIGDLLLQLQKYERSKVVVREKNDEPHDE